MRVYAHEPPWSGRYGDYGWWKRGEEMWDGSGYEWIWQPPVSGTFWKVSGILADHYLPAIQRELNRELSIITEWQIEQGTQLPRTAAAEMAYEHEGFGGQQREWYDA